MIYAIGDIHGCHDQLLVLLAKIKAHAGRKPYLGIFLGDYVDRGPKSREVVNQVKGLVTGRGGHGKWIALKGNHEDMLVGAAGNLSDRQMWVNNGGVQTLESYKDHMDDLRVHAEWMKGLPLLHETENHVFVHAGLSPRYKIAEQPEEVLLWIRNWQGDDPDFGKHVVYGHTPDKKPFLLKNSSGLDTGAFYYGTLSCGVFDETKNSGPVEILQAT